MRIKTRTLTFRAVKGKATKYPIPYTAWTKTSRGFIPGNLSWEQASQRLAAQPMKATPLRGISKAGRLSPWLTVPPRELARCRQVIAATDYDPCYKGHAGIYTHGLNGAYFVEVLERYPNETVLIRNLHDVGKITCPQVQTTIEADLVYPLLRGRSLARWRFAPETHVLIVQDPDTQRGYPEQWMQETHPLTWAYLRNFEDLLGNRKSFKKHSDPARDPFYSMYSITKHTFAPYKVAWMDISATVKATVIAMPHNNDMALPEHTVMFLTTESEREAHYVTAVLNSHPVNTVVAGYIVDNHLSTHPIENVVIPKFNPKDKTHTRLAALSRKAHAAAAQGNNEAVQKAEDAINQMVANLW